MTRKLPAVAFMAALFAPALLGVVPALLPVGCTATQQRDAQTALEAADVSCVVVRAVKVDATVSDVCAASDVLRAALEAHLAKQLADPPASSSYAGSGGSGGGGPPPATAPEPRTTPDAGTEGGL